MVRDEEHATPGGEEETSMIFNGTFYEESPMESTAGTFVYDDDASEVLPSPEIPEVPQGAMSSNRSIADSYTNLASVGSSFMDYEDFDDSYLDQGDCTVQTGSQNSAIAPINLDSATDMDDADTYSPIQSLDYANGGKMKILSPGALHGDGNQGVTIIPHWVANASSSLKFVIILSCALLVGSLALICITTSVAGTNSSRYSSANSGSESIPAVGTSSPSKEFSPVPSPPKVTTFSPTLLSSNIPTEEDSESPADETVDQELSTVPFSTPSRITSSTPTMDKSSNPIVMSSESPSISPTISTLVAPTLEQSSIPTLLFSEAPSYNSSQSGELTLIPSNVTYYQSSVTPTLMPNEVSFYAIAKNRGRTNLTSLLAELPNENGEFLIHLGNWNTKDKTRCREVAYERTFDDYSNSSVPVFFTPGKNEWNNCPILDESQELWRDYFVDYESEHWNVSDWGIERDAKREENFAFFKNGGLYMGLNMVAGNVANKKDWDNRLKDNHKWLEAYVNKYWDEVEVVVIFGNSGSNHDNDLFFQKVAASMKEWLQEKPKLQLLYVKQSPKDVTLSSNIKDQEHFLMLNVKNDVWPPVKVTINTNNDKISVGDEWFTP